MQFAVPQFTDVEDKLIGPLTLKQFLMLLATGGIVMFFWSIFGLNFFFFIFAVPVVIFGIGLAFGRYNGRPLFLYLGSFISFFTKPQVRIFKREEPIMIMKVESKPKPKSNALNQPMQTEGTESRLKKLAYLLDQKTQEEQDLIKK